MAVDALRGKHHINRILPDDLGVLWSAQSYRSEITGAIRKIKSRSWKPLQDLVAHPIGPGPHPIYGGSYPCLKTRNVQDLLAEEEPSALADVSGFASMKSIQVKSGDLLINLTGAGSIGRVAVYYGCDNPITNQHIARMTLKEEFDEGYVAAFLVGYWGERALEQGVAGSTGQINMVNEHVRSVPVPICALSAQKRIGDKVRQAEKLRRWAKYLVREIDECFSLLTNNPIASKSFWRVASDEISTYRINPKEYDPVVFDLMRKAIVSGVKLVSISEMLGPRGLSGGATPKGACYVDKGTLFARVQNVKPLALDLGDAVFIDAATDEELARSRCVADDIILTITGYPGTASLVTEADLPVNINQHSVRIDCSIEYDTAYVCAALNSTFLKYQIDRSAIGATRDALDYPSVGRLLIPLLDALVMEDIADSVRDVICARRMSKQLLASAKLLVESLIEGQITEAQLIDAQQALEAGDDSLDRAILARLKTDGLDGAGEPLFPDLDQLYDLLERAQPEVEA